MLFQLAAQFQGFFFSQPAQLQLDLEEDEAHGRQHFVTHALNIHRLCTAISLSSKLYTYL